MRSTMFYAVMIAAGPIWFAALALPISPFSSAIVMEHEFGGWPASIGMLFVASSLACLPLCQMFRSGNHSVVIFGGMLYTILCAMLFSAILVGTAAFSEHLRFGHQMPAILDLLETTLIVMWAGSFGLLMSAVHVAFPTGVAIAYLYRKVLGTLSRSTLNWELRRDEPPTDLDERLSDLLLINETALHESMEG